MDTKIKKAIRNNLLRWYADHQRELPWRATRDPYCIWVSEVMLQQTQVATVIPYYKRFLEQFPDIQSLAAADDQVVLKAWEGLGYYARARNLHHAARIVVNKYSGKIPLCRKIFRQLPGVGDYINAAVLSIADGQSLPVVDGNVKRVYSRVFCIDAPVNKSTSHRIFLETARAVLGRSDARTFNQAVMELGALVCKPRQPLCRQCPLNEWCCTRKKACVREFPKRLESSPTPLVHVVCGVTLRKRKILIVRRKAEGLLGGLWEFPGGRIDSADSSRRACIDKVKERVGLKVKSIDYLTEITHAYTHFKIRMQVFICRQASGAVRLNGHQDHRWVSLEELSQVPVPKAHLKIIPLLHEQRI